MAQKQREMMAQVELAHQRELSEQLKKHDTLITEKQKGSHYHACSFWKQSCNLFLAIDTLKQQIAELMTGQSSTRQAQIEELRKKLIEAAKEANELR